MSYNNLDTFSEKSLSGNEVNIVSIAPALQSSAYQLTRRMNVTNVIQPVNGGLKLPTANIGRVLSLKIKNNSNVYLFPSNEDDINSNGPNTPIVIGQGVRTCICFENGFWSVF